MSSPVCTESGFIGQSQRCCSLASCARCSGTDLLRTEMRIAEGVGSEWLGCCKRFFRAELNIRKARHGEGQFWVIRVVLTVHRSLPVFSGGLNRSSQHFILEGKMECGMERRFHRGFTAAEKTELWDRWKRGESLKAIGRAFGKQSSSIYFLVAPHGGIRPAERRRSRLALTLAEREVISRGVTAHRSARSIAKLLGRSPSTVSREMGRNGGYDRYRATLADENAWARSRRPKCCKLVTNPRLRQAVAGKLRLDWSPEQIAGWLKRTHPEDECSQVSHETIYRSLFVQARGVLKKELLSHLRSKRSMRRSRPVDPNGDKRGHIKDIVSIRQRPAAVEDRAVPGHWEGDLLSGPNNTYIATLVERHTRYVMLAKVAG